MICNILFVYLLLCVSNDKSVNNIYINYIFYSFYVCGHGYDTLPEVTQKAVMLFVQYHHNITAMYIC